MLTEARCKSAKCPADRPRMRLADAEGLYLEIAAGDEDASKRWFWKYRAAGYDRATCTAKTVEKRLSIGAYPGVTLKAARLARDQARLGLAGGEDPAAARRNEKLAQRNKLGTSFESVARAWHEHIDGSVTDRHAGYVIRRLEADVFPNIGRTPIAEITAPQLIALAKRVESRGARHMARKVLQHCGQVFRYAIAHGLLERNPAADVKPGDVLKKRKAKNYARLDAKDLPGFLREVDAYTGLPYTRLAMHLMSYTFVRTSELIGARWSEFEDLDGAEPTWRIQADRMKMGMQHIVPLSRQALDVLAELQKYRRPSDLLFPGRGDCTRSMSNNTILKAIDRLGYKGRMTGHGFRGVASTILHELGWRHDWIELQLAHIERDTVSAAYNHATYLVDRRRMMQAWGDHLDVLRADRRVIAGRFGRAA